MLSTAPSNNRWPFNNDTTGKPCFGTSFSRNTSGSYLADDIIKRAISLDEIDNKPKLEHSASLDHIDNNPKLEHSASLDEIDTPKIGLSAFINEKDRKLFETMKYELNRLNSFNGKWPLTYVKPCDLAEAGLFYLQSEDNVQCAFCKEIMNDWNVGDKPSKVHMRKSPKCPFLLTLNVGNVPIIRQVPLTHLNKTSAQGIALPTNLSSNTSSYRPKHPRMTDVNKRLLTYKDWPCIMLSPKQLSECGLYYTGVADVVTCFFCGGSLANWELNDDPWEEHIKFFPHCAYMSLSRKHGRPQQETSLKSPFERVVQAPLQNPSITTYPVHSVETYVQQAKEIFPAHLVHTVASEQLRRHGHHFSSLNELCEAVLEHSRKLQPTSSQSEDEVIKPQAKAVVISSTEEKKEIKDTFLCKICMDREMGVVFLPCGHLVSCPKCAEVIFDCPLCRTPVTSKVRTYLS